MCVCGREKLPSRSVVIFFHIKRPISPGRLTSTVTHITYYSSLFNHTNHFRKLLHQLASHHLSKCPPLWTASFKQTLAGGKTSKSLTCSAGWRFHRRARREQVCIRWGWELEELSITSSHHHIVWSKVSLGVIGCSEREPKSLSGLSSAVAQWRAHSITSWHSLAGWRCLRASSDRAVSFCTLVVKVAVMHCLDTLVVEHYQLTVLGCRQCKHTHKTHLSYIFSFADFLFYFQGTLEKQRNEAVPRKRSWFSPLYQRCFKMNYVDFLTTHIQIYPDVVSL